MKNERDPLVVHLRDVRQRRHLSLEDTARLTGLTGVAIGSYERGDRQPPLEALRQWAAGLGLELMAVGSRADVTSADDGTAWSEWAVQVGDRRIDCDDYDDACGLAWQIGLAARVVTRRVWAQEWRQVAVVPPQREPEWEISGV